MQHTTNSVNLNSAALLSPLPVCLGIYIIVELTIFRISCLAAVLIIGSEIIEMLSGHNNCFKSFCCSERPVCYLVKFLLNRNSSAKQKLVSKTLHLTHGVVFWRLLHEVFYVTSDLPSPVWRRDRNKTSLEVVSLSRFSHAILLRLVFFPLQPKQKITC